jgi:hypothetical protein
MKQQTLLEELDARFACEPAPPPHEVIAFEPATAFQRGALACGQK